MSVFYFKQFSVKHEQGVMPLTLDPVLLADYIGRQSKGLGLDIGTGNGIIPMILAQRSPELRMIGIDINPFAVKLSDRNFKASPFMSRLRAVESDIFQFTHDRPFDLICSNPPFYRNGIEPGSSHLAIAKHDSRFSWPLFFKKAYELSHDRTRLFLIFPELYWDSLRIEAVSSGWYVKRWSRVGNSSDPGDSIRLLVEWERRRQDLPTHDGLVEFPEPESTLSNRHVFEGSRDLYIWQ